jgi:hypothetical protein
MYYVKRVVVDGVLCSTADKLIAAARMAADFSTLNVGSAVPNFTIGMTEWQLKLFNKRVRAGLLKFRPETKIGHSPIRLATIGRMLDATDASPPPTTSRREAAERLMERASFLVAHQGLLRVGEYTDSKLLWGDLTWLWAGTHIVGVQLLLRNAKTGSYTNGERGHQTAVLYRRGDRFCPVMALWEWQQARFATGAPPPTDPVFQHLDRGKSARVWRPLMREDVNASIHISSRQACHEPSGW